MLQSFFASWDIQPDFLLCPQADISGKVFADEAAGLYERATTTMLKNCTLLYFAYADFEEVRCFLVVLA